MIRYGALTDTITVYNLVADPLRGHYNEEIFARDGGTEVKALVEPSDSNEDQIGRETRIQLFKITMSPDVDVSATSEIDWHGRSLEALGEPLTYYLRGLPHHIEMEAREVLG